jgi:hypothetical protein
LLAVAVARKLCVAVWHVHARPCHRRAPISETDAKAWLEVYPALRAPKYQVVLNKHLTFRDENTVDYASKRAIEPGESLIHWGLRA